MQPHPISLDPHDLITKARSLMRSTGLRTLIVTEDGKLSGLVTARQMLRITSTRSNIPVAGLMFPPRLIAVPNDNLANLVRNMLKLDVTVAPVVQSIGDQTLVGIVRFEDILKYIAKAPLLRKLTVGKIMSKTLTTCTPDDLISRVWDVMERTGYSGLPVTRYNKQKRVTEVIGMITRADIIKSGFIRLAGEAAKGGRSPPRVRIVMRTPAITVSPSTPVSEAAELMVRRKIGRLPIVEAGELLGIVDREDVIKTCL
jgi:CBS domain-containing protein